MPTCHRCPLIRSNLRSIGERGLQAGALLCFVLADHAVAHGHPAYALPDVRLVGTAVPTDTDAYSDGKRLLASGDIAGALSAFRQAAAATPDAADALNGIGVCYDRLGRTDLARTFYRAGLAIDPISPTLLNNLGYSLFLDGDFAGAVTPLRAAAASTDLAAASAAQATLDQLTAQASRRLPQADPPTAMATVRIEQTTEGEQRLTFARVAASEAAALSTAATLGDAANAIVVAAAWTPGDDTALIAQVHAEERAEAEQQTRSTEAVPNDASSNAQPAEQSRPTVQVAAARAEPEVRTTNEVRQTALVLSADASLSAVRRRVAADQRDSVRRAGEGPKPQFAAVFESDDAELNAFATRLRADAPVNRHSPIDEAGRIAARFRS